MEDSFKFAKISELCGGKSAAVFGAGASGKAAKALLEKAGIKAVVYDKNGGESCEKIFDENSAKKHRLAVYSPAFRPDHEWVRLAEKAGARAICEPDLSALAWRGKIYAVTGTNGKTTLTSFLERALNTAGIKAISAGNIGKPLSAFCAEMDDTSTTAAVCELSSFQTSRLEFLRPDALLWTNFAPDHLDWHTDMREYFSAKFNLVKNLKTKFLFAGSDVFEVAKEYGFKIPDFAKIPSQIDARECPKPFDTSVQSLNYSMAYEFLKELGIGWAAAKAAEGFSLPKYRFGEPCEKFGIKFYNDSKATNVHAAVAALRELAGAKNLVWIGGGKDKLCDVSELASEVMKVSSGAVLIGQTAEKLANIFNATGFNAKICQSMKEAVECAAKMAGEGGNVLFSPGFSSFGMFAGYADRGKSFQNEVLCLKNLK